LNGPAAEPSTAGEQMLFRVVRFGLLEAAALAGDDLALAGMVGRADEALLLHALDEGCRTVVADGKAALDVGGRALAVAHDDLDGLLVEVVAILGGDVALVEHRAAGGLLVLFLLL